jgi:virginiamycin B lyase
MYRNLWGDRIGHHFFGSSLSSIVNLGMIVRLILSILATLGSIALAWTTINPPRAQASGITETPTQANPWDVAIDTSGHVWVAEPGCDAEPNCPTTFPSYIGEYRGSDTLLNNFLEPSGFSSPTFLVVSNNGAIWFTETTTNAIGRLIHSTPPTWRQWTVPTPNANPYDLVFDNNGNIWFTEYSGNKIGFFNTSTKKFVENAIPTPASQPYGITKDPSGKIWFAENTQQKIGSFTPTLSGTVTITEHVINNPGGPMPHLITADSAGNIWYSEGFSGDIGKFVPKTNTHTNINVSRNVCPTPTPGVTPTPCPSTHISGIAVDGTGRIWFDDSLTARVGVYNPISGIVRTLTLSNPNAHPHNGLAVDSKGNTWFAEVFGGPTGMLGKIPVGTL